MLGSWLPSLMLSRAQAKLCPGPLDLLVSVPKLVHPRPHAPISHVKDASDTHLGAVLQQLLDGSWAPLMFYCKKLSDAEKKYSTLDSELLAAYSSLRHFHLCLKVETLQFLPTTSLSPLHCLEFLHLGRPFSSATSPTWLSSRAPWSASLGLRTW